MYPIQCSVMRKKGYDQIHVAGNPMFLTVYTAEHPGFYPDNRQKQFYAETGDTLLVFETTGYHPLINPFYIQAMYAAITWYARTQLNCPGIKVKLTDPRRANKDRFAN